MRATSCCCTYRADCSETGHQRVSTNMGHSSLVHARQQKCRRQTTMRLSQAKHPNKKEAPTRSNLFSRFYEHKSVEELNKAVLVRVRAPDYMRCAIFPSQAGMRRCSRHLQKNTDIAHPLQEISFTFRPHICPETAIWARFSAVLYPEEYTKHVREVWASKGDGISSRHAEYCLKRFSLMDSHSLFPALQTSATGDVAGELPPQPWSQSHTNTTAALRARVANLVNSDKPGQEAVKVHDVFLYPKGMCAIGTVARALAPISVMTSEAVVYG